MRYYCKKCGFSTRKWRKWKRHSKDIAKGRYPKVDKMSHLLWVKYHRYATQRMGFSLSPWTKAGTIKNLVGAEYNKPLF